MQESGETPGFRRSPAAIRIRTPRESETTTLRISQSEHSEASVNPGMPAVNYAYTNEHDQSADALLVHNLRAGAPFRLRCRNSGTRPGDMFSEESVNPGKPAVNYAYTNKHYQSADHFLGHNLRAGAPFDLNRRNPGSKPGGNQASRRQAHRQ